MWRQFQNSEKDSLILELVWLPSKYFLACLQNKCLVLCANIVTSLSPTLLLKFVNKDVLEKDMQIYKDCFNLLALAEFYSKISTLEHEASINHNL